jgi:hypothetical protein
VSAAPSLPTALVPDVAKVFQAWLISTQNQSWPFNTMVVQILFDWLALIENRMSPRFFRGPTDAPPSLNIPHLNEVHDEIRMTAFAFAHLNHAAAQNYLSHLDQETVSHHYTQAILRAPGTLARAAPSALVDFMLEALIKNDDTDALHGRRGNRYGPLSIHDHLFSPVSTPEQKCIGWPEQKYISDLARRPPNWGPFRQASSLRGIIRRVIGAGRA